MRRGWSAPGSTRWSRWRPGATRWGPAGAPLLDTAGTVNVFNLVEGEEVLVESPEGAFEPMRVHYAETFVVPAATGAFAIRNDGRSTAMLMRAHVRGTEER